MTWPAPEFDQCLAYKGEVSHMWFVMTAHGRERFYTFGFNDAQALTEAEKAGKERKWIKSSRTSWTETRNA